MDELRDSLNQECPSDTDLLRIVFQGKWRLRVLQEIVKGPVRLSQLRRAVPECSKKVLIDTLYGPEELGWMGLKNSAGSKGKSILPSSRELSTH